MTVFQLSTLLGGIYSGSSADDIVTGFATDSRSVLPGNAFLAIKGENVDGHDYAAGLQHAVSIVERPVDAPHILVPNLVDALARMASKLRESFGGPVIGITGSAGKTTTKELLAAALEVRGPILKTPGNRNTEYTVPLIWPEVDGSQWAAIVEMSMRGSGQIRHLASFSRPTIGVITNIGYSHIEVVGSREGIARAKGELLEALPTTGTTILWHGDEFLALLRSLAPCRVKTFGFSEGADAHISHYEPLSWTSCLVVGLVEEETFEITLPSVGKHIALNAVAALLAAKTAGVGVREAADAMGRASLPPMRMEIIEFNGATVVLDTYNASPASVMAALETMAALPVSGRRLAVLGEMRELGEFSEEAHRSVGTALAASGVEETLYLGPAMEHMCESAVAAGMSRESLHPISTRVEITSFLQYLRPGDAVLIKGSRAWELEKALEPLGVSVGH